MHITPERIEEFVRLYKEEFGEELHGGDAEVMVQQLLEFYQMILAPLPSESLPQQEQ